MDPAARANAIAEIQSIFGAYRAAQPNDPADLAVLTDGKLYELFVLSDLLTDLSNRGFTLTFVGSTPPPGAAAASHSTLKFKASPGQIKTSDSHFEVRSPGSSTADYRIFVNIEFDTLGHRQQAATDYSRRHELDIIVTTASMGYPAHDEIALGVECKAVANFYKGLIKEALGVRRELSLLQTPSASTLSSAGGRPLIYVAADPPSEFRLAFIDPKGSNYAQSPSVFGIELKHLQP
jgi:hypothetical protein